MSNHMYEMNVALADEHYPKGSHYAKIVLPESYDDEAAQAKYKDLRTALVAHFGPIVSTSLSRIERAGRQVANDEVGA